MWTRTHRKTFHGPLAQLHVSHAIAGQARYLRQELPRSKDRLTEKFQEVRPKDEHIKNNFSANRSPAQSASFYFKTTKSTRTNMSRMVSSSQQELLSLNFVAGTKVVKIFRAASLCRVVRSCGLNVKRESRGVSPSIVLAFSTSRECPSGAVPDIGDEACPKSVKPCSDLEKRAWDNAKTDV